MRRSRIPEASVLEASRSPSSFGNTAVGIWSQQWGDQLKRLHILLHRARHHLSPTAQLADRVQVWNQTHMRLTPSCPRYVTLGKLRHSSESVSPSLEAVVFGGEEPAPFLSAPKLLLCLWPSLERSKEALVP